jgi:hypothetical protein
MEANPKQYFRGCWLPPEVFDHLRTKQINGKEVALLALIDSFVSGGRDCYATNDYLGEWMGISASQINKMLARLERVGLLRKRVEAHRRYLLTAWSRPNITPVVTPHKEVRKIRGGGSAKFAEQPVLVNIPETGGGGMFFENKTKAGNPTKQDMANATRLNNTMRAVRKATGPFNITKAADQFRLLRTQDSIPAKEVNETLTWYLAHHQDEFVPRAYTAEYFRRKYTAIREAMARAPVPVEITDEHKAIFNAVKDGAWPGVDKQQLLQTIAASTNGLRAWRGRLKDYTPTDPREARFVGVVLQHTGDVRHFMTQWFLSLSQRIATWEGWRGGDIARYGWRPDAKEFTRMGYGWATTYAGRTDPWNRLVKGVEDAK